MSLRSERELSSEGRGLYTRAKAAAQSKNYDYTISLMQALLKDEPLFLEGRRFLRAVEIQKYKALSGFNRQMLGMKLSTATMKLGGAAKKEPNAQLIQAEEVLALDPFHPKANALVGEAGAKLGLPEFRAFAYETLAQELGEGKAKASDRAVLHTLADTYMELRDYQKAEKTYSRILEIDPRDGDALSGLKNASAAHTSKSGGWETAGADYRNALKNKQESIDLEQASKVVKSTEAIDEQIRINLGKHEADPASPIHARNLAQLFLQKNDLANAILFYEHAFEMGGRIDPSIEKIIGDLKLKKAEEELSRLSVGQEDEEANPELQTQRLTAMAEKQKEIIDVRLAQAQARVRAHPNEGQYHYEFGEALYKSGQYKRAGEELQFALKQPSVRYQAMNYMGLSFMKRGMLDFAIKQLAGAESELPVMDDLKKEIVYNLGLAYEANTQADKALDQWKKIYEVDMGYRDVAERVEASYGS
jgi:tetratricopeptide (TPR) repeat protein